MSAIFYHNEEQKRLALKSKEGQESIFKGTIHTVIEPLEVFYLAEDYHQKYLLQQSIQLSKFFKKNPLQAFVDSTPASKINGYLGGNGTVEGLMKEIDSFGISQEAKTDLINIVQIKTRS
jgi:hypothetical protein